MFFKLKLNHCKFPNWTELPLTNSTSKPILSAADPPPIFYNRLIAHYTEIDHVLSARNVFDRMPHRTVASYNSMVSAYGRSGCLVESFEVISMMLASGIRPNNHSFGGLLSSPLTKLWCGFVLQALILKMGFLGFEPFTTTALLGLYGREGRLDDVMKLLEEMPEPGVVTWNSVIYTFATWGYLEDCMLLFKHLLRPNLGPSEASFLGILRAISMQEGSRYGVQIHGLALRIGMTSYSFVGNALIEMYSICSHVCYAERLFTDMANKDVVSWNTMINAFSRSKMPEKSLEIFFRMVFNGFHPNETTFTIAITASSDIQMPVFGQVLHGKATKRNLDVGHFASSALVSFYAKTHSFSCAEKLFNEIPVKTVASWNALIAGSPDNARLETLRRMLSLGFKPNEFSFPAGLKGSSFQELQQLHSLIIRMGYVSNAYISAAIVSSYGSQDKFSEALEFAEALGSRLSVVPTNIVAGIYNRCGEYQQTQELLSHCENPDIVSWNILISSCSRTGDCAEAILFLKQMLIGGILPDRYTMVSLLSTCTKLSRLDLGCSLHGLMIKLCYDSFDVFVRNVLLDMYAKCGNLNNSLRIFEEMSGRNVISWTTMITALGIHGWGQRAVDKFREMVHTECFEPDRVVFLAVLKACRHGGMVREGMRFFKSMKGEFGIDPDMDHYVCVVDLLCGNGFLKEAEDVICGMPFQPNAALWRAFLHGYQNFNCKIKSRSMISWY